LILIILGVISLLIIIIFGIRLLIINYRRKKDRKEMLKAQGIRR
jgi:hypothetical protein